jgi:two-component system sensor histidine kinase CiaH
LAMMKNWKQLGVWVTGLRSNPFTWARFKLTLLYSAVILLGIIGYIFLLNRELDTTTNLISQEISDPGKKARFIDRSSRVAFQTLYTIQPEDILMIFIVIGISYFLAGVALKPIKETMDQQKVFLENATHQLKTPLAIIKTELEVFLRDKKNYGQIPNTLIRKKSEVISNLEEVNRMGQVVDDLLLVARIDNQQSNLQIEPLDLKKLIQTTAKNLQSYGENKNVSLIFKPADSIFVNADSDKLQQVFYNLLKNGIDCTTPNGKVTITLKQNQDKVTVEIADNGIGIAKEEQSLIFKRFYRTKNSINHHIKGTGLGLTIAKWVVKKHGGIIKVESELTKGTVFTITLPSLKTS